MTTKVRFTHSIWFKLVASLNQIGYVNLFPGFLEINDFTACIGLMLEKFGNTYFGFS